MARKVKVSQFFDTEEGKRQLEIVKGYVDEFIGHVNKVQPIKAVFAQSEKPSEIINGIKQLSEAQQVQNKIVAQGAAATTKVITSMREYDKAMVEAKLARQNYNKELKAEIQLEQAAAGTLQRLREELKQLNTVKNTKLTIGTDEYEKAVVRIKELNDQIKAEEGKAGDFRRNVGNYPESAKIIVDALEKARDRTAKLNAELGETHPAAQAAGRELQNLERVTSSPQFLNVAAKAGDAKRELAGMTKVLLELERTGDGKTGYAELLRKQLAELTDQVADTRDEIKAMASDTRNFDLLAGSVSFAADALETFYGAAVLAGLSEDDAAEATKKLVAIQSVSNGIKGIATELTTKGTAANKVYAAIQGVVATATDKSAAASVRAAAGLKLLLGGLVIGGLALLVIKMIEWSKAADAAGKKQKILNEVARAAADSYGKEKAELDLLMTSIRAEGISRKEKFEILKELQDKYPGYFDNIKTEKDLNEKLAVAYEKAAQGILLKAKAQAAGDLLAKNEAELLTKEIDFQEKQTKLMKLTQEQLRLANGRGTESIAQSLNTGLAVAKETFDKEAKELQEKSAFLIETVSKSNDEILKLGGKINKPGKTAKEDSRFKLDEEIRKAQFESNKLRLQSEIDANARIVENEKEFYNRRIDATQGYYNKRMQLIMEQKVFDLEGVDASENEQIRVAQREKKGADVIAAIRRAAAEERKVIEARINAEIISLNADSEKQITELVKSNQEERKKKRDEARQDYIDTLQDQLEETIEAAQKASNEQLQAELDHYTAGLLTKEQYEENKLRIETEFQRQSLLAQIAYYEALAKISLLSPEAEEEALKQLQDYKQKLYDLDVKAQEDANDRKGKSNEGFFKKYKEQLSDLSSELQETVFSILEGSIDKQKNAVQEQMDQLDIRKAKEIEAANQTILNEQDKAAAITVIEKRAQSEREALQRRQRELDVQRARFEKAKAIMNIIQNTAQGITAALASVPPNPILAAIVGAIGAAQLVRTLATPIPKYAKGTEDHPGGLAVVGDGGEVEYIETPDGKVLRTPATPTLVDLPKHSKVITQRDMQDSMMAMHLFNSLHPANPVSDDGKYFMGVEKKIQHMEKEVVRAIKNIPPPPRPRGPNLWGWVHE